MGDLTSPAEIKAKAIKQQIAVMTDRFTGSNKAEESIQECADESIGADDIVKIGAYAKLNENKKEMIARRLKFIKRNKKDHKTNRILSPMAIRHLTAMHMSK